MAQSLISPIGKERGQAATAMRNSLEIEGRPQDTRVVVAMSGGVDSSVTAALLKAEGYDVVGVTLQLYDHGAMTHRKGACCAGQDIHDARSVADRIGIPHYVLDYESRFKEAVIDRFAESYVSGETPVPCVDCNMAIKFRDLLSTARELGAAVLATGHYVASRALPEGGRALYRAREEERDQSYFLFGTTREQLDLLRYLAHRRRGAEQCLGRRASQAGSGGAGQVPQLRLLQRAVHDGAEVRQLDRLREEALGARLHRLHCERDVAVAGDHHDDRSMLARPRQYVEPRHVGELEVEQHQRRTLGLDHGDRLLARRGTQHVVPRPLEVAGEGSGEVRLVVDDEYLGHQDDD
jgi:PP-loop superfamily ATP-utilizing enzyme